MTLWFFFSTGVSFLYTDVLYVALSLLLPSSLYPSHRTAYPSRIPPLICSSHSSHNRTLVGSISQQLHLHLSTVLFFSPAGTLYLLIVKTLIFLLFIFAFPFQKSRFSYCLNAYCFFLYILFSFNVRCTTRLKRLMFFYSICKLDKHI